MANSAGISFSGLGSGLDTASIISQLISLERRPIQRLQVQSAQIEQRKAAYDQFRQQLVSLNASLNSFNQPNIFDPVRTTSSNAEAISITASSGSGVGVREMTVRQLAQAQRIASSPQSSPTAQLGLSGRFRVNDVQVDLVATDTLQSIASKINGANANVTASVVDGGSGSAFLTLTSSRTGAANAIRLEQVGIASPIEARDGVLARLGLIGFSAQTVERPGYVSGAFSSSDSTAFSSIGLSGEQRVEVGGVGFTFDFSSGTLDDLAARINAIPEIEARVVTANEGGNTVFRLEVSGATRPVTQGLDELGMVEGTSTYQLAARDRTQLVAAQDAIYTIDGIELNSSSNTLTNVIQGATVTLNQADPNRRVNLSVTRDTEAVVGTIRGMVTNFNRVNQFIRDNSRFNAETFESGIFFADSVAAQVQASLAGTAFNNAAGLSGDLRNITQLGFGLDSEGALTLDEAALRRQIEAKPTGVANVFRSTGTASTSQLTYVSSNGKTRASVGSGYAVNITQAATQTQVRAAAAQTGPTAQSEELLFSGSQLGRDPIRLTIPAGSTQQDIVQRINNESRLRGAVSASIEDGRIVVRSTRFGAGSNFDVSSNVAAGPNSSGIGTGGQATKTLGVDVQGTINGEPATGSGQFLTGNVGNANTEGLQIQYTGTTTGEVGRMAFSKGVGSLLADTVDTFLNRENGLISTTTQAFDAQITQFRERIESINRSISDREVSLRRRFAVMDEAVARSNAQLQRLQASLSQLRG